MGRFSATRGGVTPPPPQRHAVGRLDTPRPARSARPAIGAPGASWVKTAVLHSRIKARQACIPQVCDEGEPTMSGPDNDQRQGQRTSKVKKKWIARFFNIQTARTLISLGRLAVELARVFDN